MDESNVVIVEAERSTHYAVETEDVTGVLEQRWKRPETQQPVCIN